MATGTHRGGILARPTSIDGVWGWITTVDAKRIGMMYITTSILFFLHLSQDLVAEIEGNHSFVCKNTMLGKYENARKGFETWL